MTIVRGGLQDQILQGLKDPTLAGVLVMGGAGMGKTHLAHAVASAVQEEFDVTWLVGQRLLEQEPFSVLESIVPSMSTDRARSEPADTMTMVQLLYERLIGKSPVPTKRVLVLVDNAQWLDEHSCAVLEQLAVSGAAQMLLLCRPGESNVARSSLFTDDTMMAQRELPPFTTGEVMTAIEKTLGGKIVPGVAAVMAASSGGHPLFLQALLNAARETEALVKHGSIWALTAAPMDPEPNVGDVAIDLFREYSAREQEILETVALAEPLATTVLHRIFSGNEHESLISAGVLCVTSGMASTLQFVSPVFGQSLRQRIPVGRSIEARRQVLAARALQPLSSTMLMRHIAWSHDCGADVTQRSLLHGARLANIHSESRLARRLSQSVSDPKYLFQARLEETLACIKLQEFAEGRKLLDELGLDAGDRERCDQVGTLGVMMAASLGFRNELFTRLADSWRQRYATLGLAECPGADLVEALIVVKSGFFLPKDMRSRLEIIGGSADHIGLKFAAAALLAHAEVIEGNHTAAEHNFTRAHKLLLRHPGWLGMFRHVLTGQHMLFLVSAGCPERALDLLDASRIEAEDHRSVEFHGLMELVRSLGELGQGNVVTAAASFDVALAALGEADPADTLPYALAAAAYTQHLIGNDAKALELVRDFHAIVRDVSGPLWLLSMAYLAAAKEAGKNKQKTFKALHELAEEARQQGAAAVEMAIHNVMLREGCRTHIARMLEIELSPEGPAIPMMRSIADGILSEDASLLESVASLPGAAQNKLLAVEALSHALHIHSKHGNHGGRTQVLKQLRKMNFPFQAMGSVAIADLATIAELTGREKEIAALVHSRYSNRDIAEKFTLSQRTIEGHVYKIYSKLGVGSREELYEPWLLELLST